MTHRLGPLLLLIVLVGTGPGCAVRAQGAGASPSTVGEPGGADEELGAAGPSSLDDFEQQLASAAVRLDEQLRLAEGAWSFRSERWATPPAAGTEAPEDGLVPASPSQPVPTQPPPEAQGGYGASQSEAPHKSAAGAERESACDAVCHAIESMRRAADGICRIAGQGDERCGHAVTRVREAEQRIARAGCGCAR